MAVGGEGRWLSSGENISVVEVYFLNRYVVIPLCCVGSWVDSVLV